MVIPDKFFWDKHPSEGYDWMEMWPSESKAVIRAYQLKELGARNIYIDTPKETSTKVLWTIYYDGEEIYDEPPWGW